MGVVTGGIVDQFHRDDPNGNMALLKDALEDEVQQRRLSTAAIAPILNHMAPWITHLRDLPGDAASLRVGLKLEGQINDRDLDTLARVLNLPGGPGTTAAVAEATTAPPAKPIQRKPARTTLDEGQADAAFNEFDAVLTTTPPAETEADRREWSASGAPRRR